MEGLIITVLSHTQTNFSYACFNYITRLRIHPVPYPPIILPNIPKSSINFLDAFDNFLCEILALHIEKVEPIE